MTFHKRSVKTPEFGTLMIAGSFAPAGTGAVTAVRGSGFSVARTGVGEYTITLDEQVNEIVAANATLQMNAATDLNAQFMTYTAASRTFILNALAGATPTEIAANANNRVSFCIIAKKSNAT